MPSSRYETYKELLLYSSTSIDFDSEPALRILFSPYSLRYTGMSKKDSAGGWKDRKNYRERKRILLPVSAFESLSLSGQDLP